MHKTSVLSCIVLFAISAPVYSQDLPKFDGVYLGLKDGTFEKLSPFTGQQVVIDNYGATEEATPQLFVPVIIDGVALESDILSATFFDSSNVESIFIRSRSIRLNFVENVVPMRDLYLRNYGFENDSVRREAYYERLDREFPGISGTKCGVQAASMNLLNESETTYQFFFEGSKLLDQSGADVQLFYAQKEGCFVGSANDASKSLGLLLSTNGGNFLLLETDAMRDYYLSPNLMGWTNVAALTAKIETADR